MKTMTPTLGPSAGAAVAKATRSSPTKVPKVANGICSEVAQ
jgi:hypothetical protein